MIRMDNRNNGHNNSSDEWKDNEKKNKIKLEYLLMNFIHEKNISIITNEYLLINK